MSSEIEQPPFPSAPVTTLSANVILQPPLSRPGIGPGIVIFLPKPDRVGISSNAAEIYDPEPPTKWAKEGFAVVAITDFDGLVVEDVLKEALNSLQSLDKVDVKDKFAVIGGRFVSSDYQETKFTIFNQYTSLDLSVPFLRLPPRNLA
jgi:carboxymethylenebutenolidase